MVGLLGPDYRGMPLQERKRYVLLATRPKAMATTIDEHEQAVARLADAPSGALRNDLPLHILTHGVPWPDQEYEHLWQESQRQALTWSSRSKLIVAEQSGHAIMLAQPELVIEAIREIIEEARA
jgi:pimeloyl-ACP methyl ester carboxylesterase